LALKNALAIAFFADGRKIATPTASVAESTRISAGNILRTRRAQKSAKLNPAGVSSPLMMIPVIR
jgi:hypothetical protein